MVRASGEDATRRHVQLVGGQSEDSVGRDYVSTLAWECLGIHQAKTEVLAQKEIFGVPYWRIYDLVQFNLPSGETITALHRIGFPLQLGRVKPSAK